MAWKAVHITCEINNPSHFVRERRMHELIVALTFFIYDNKFKENAIHVHLTFALMENVSTVYHLFGLGSFLQQNYVVRSIISNNGHIREFPFDGFVVDKPCFCMFD